MPSTWSRPLRSAATATDTGTKPADPPATDTGTKPAGPPVRAALPGPYLLWLAGTQAGLLGDAALYLALGWAASAHGGGAAGLVLTAITLPRTVLVLLGGAVADRFGARRVMLAGDAVMLVAALALAAAAAVWGTPLR
ncbi:MFS transporter, partial [Kitasatospora sp. NPDC058263]